MSQPRIAVFARMANGNVRPVRTIEGQATRLSRTMHGIAYDPVHDEIAVPVGLAAAILVFRGEAQGAEPPVRIIQGPRTRLVLPYTVSFDTENGEIIVGDTSARSLFFYSRQANGDVAPRREIHGPRTGLVQIVGVAADPRRNLVVAASASRVGGQSGLFVFGRTDQGDVPPRAVIAGPRTGILRPWQVVVDPEEGKIFAAVININYMPPYRLDKVREELPGDFEMPSPWASDQLGFIGVWDIRDNGDVPPRFVIRGPAGGLVHPGGVAFNARDREVFATDSVRNGLLTFLAPEFFRPWARAPGPTSGARR